MDPYYNPPLSLEGWREIEDEIANGSPMTPERRAMFDRVRQMEGVRQRRPWPTELSPDPYRPTLPLSLEGSREVEEEMARPPADTPGRRALFERVRVREAMRARVAAVEQRVQKP